MYIYLLSNPVKTAYNIFFLKDHLYGNSFFHIQKLNCPLLHQKHFHDQ